MFSSIYLLYEYSKFTWNYIKLIYYFRKITKNPNLLDDKNVLNNIINIVRKNGCMLVKLIQWGLPRYKMIYGNNDLTRLLDNLYDKCPIHSIEHTKNIYQKEFINNLDDNYEIIEVIGSGSLGQVYKAIDIKNDRKVAIKVTHPKIEEEFTIFKIFFNITHYMFNFSNILPIKNINTIVEDLEKQLDYNIEAYNLNYFYNLYKDNKYINIPKVHNYSKNIIIMDFLEIEKNELTEVQRYKTLMLMVIFINNSCLNGFSHGDLHIGNWSNGFNSKPYLNVIDFGFCFNINFMDYCMVDKYVGNPANKNILKEILLHVSYDKSKQIINKISEELYELTKKCKNKDIEQYIKLFIKILLDNDIKVNSSILNCIFLYYQLSSLYKFILDSNKNNNTLENNFSLEILNLCETFDICEEYQYYLKKHIIRCFNYKKENESLMKYKNLCIK